MPGRKPIDVTVPPGTPVHVHVSRRQKTNVQALTESLFNAQRQDREDAKGVLREAGNRYLSEQKSKRGMKSGSKSRKIRGCPCSCHEPCRCQKKEAFYPAPNKTHKPKKSLQQGGVTFDATGYPKKKGAASLTMDDLSAPMADAEARAQNYQQQVSDLTRTVDELR